MRLIRTLSVLLLVLPHLRPQVPPPRRPARTRPYAPHPPVVPPDYGRFCEVGMRHRPRWRLTYEPGQAAAYQAHHRADESVVLAASDVESLDFALAEFAPPPYARPYIDGRLTAPAQRRTAGVV